MSIEDIEVVVLNGCVTDTTPRVEHVDDLGKIGSQRPMSGFGWSFEPVRLGATISTTVRARRLRG